MNYYDNLTLDFSSYLKKQKTSWVGSDQNVVEPGDTIKFDCSHKDSKVLGKVKSVDFHNGEYLTVNLEITDVDSIKENASTPRYKGDAIDACRYAFENLKLSLRSAQDQEISKYTIKDESELSTPYDIWEKNKIEKGEFSMNTYDVAYNEKKAAAQKAFDEAMVEAKKEKEEAALKEAYETAAKSIKSMYDAYINAGFTPEQAEKFVTIALEKSCL